MKAYHLFRLADAHFAYHIPAGRFIAISPGAYEFLRARQEGESPVPDAQLRDDIAKLEEAGFFDEAEPPILSDAEFDAEVADKLAAPRNSVFLSVASGCNLACRYCYCGTCRDKLPNQGLMPEETALRAVDALFRDADPGKDVRITFFGGEPLLNKPAIRSVVKRSRELAKARGTNAGFSITTNATLIDDETAALLTDFNFGLMVSLDGPKELHDAQCPARGGDGSFELAAKGIRTLMKRRKQVTVRCTMAHPAPDAMRLIRFFQDFGFTRVVLGTVRNPTFPSECDFTKEDDEAFDRCMEREILPWMIAERKAGREPIYDPFDEIAAFQGEENHPEKVPAMRCGACHGSMAASPDGTLYPCHRFVGMGAWAIGTLDAGPDMEKCKAFWRSYRACMKGECAQCWAYRVCGGPCPWEIARADGTFAMSGQLCAETLSWIRQGAYYLHKTGDAGQNKGDKQ